MASPGPVLVLLKPHQLLDKVREKPVQEPGNIRQDELKEKISAHDTGNREDNPKRTPTPQGSPAVGIHFGCGVSWVGPGVIARKGGE